MLQVGSHGRFGRYEFFLRKTRLMVCLFAGICKKRVYNLTVRTMSSDKCIPIRHDPQINVTLADEW